MPGPEAAENGQAEYEVQLVGDGYAAHLRVAQRADHQVVQKVDEIGNTVLDDHGNNNRQHRAVKSAVADQGAPGLGKHGSHPGFTSLNSEIFIFHYRASEALVKQGAFPNIKIVGNFAVFG